MAREVQLLRMLAATAMVACVSGPAHAGTSTTTFLVSLTVANNCSISANPLPFGTATSALTTTAINQSTTLSVTCTNGTSYALSLDKGTTNGSTVVSRLLAGTGSNAQTVPFQLYSDSNRTTIWGDGTGGSALSGNGTGSSQSVTIYGQVPAQPMPPSDNYSSTETATVTF